MECPHCHEEIQGIECPDCSAITPLEGKFCMHCGISLAREVGDAADEEGGFDLGDRILCSDGTCTGIIIDGRCIECGKPPE
ncbi:MAG: hypothetical protein JRJ06_08045 [Deltaproteobacteria bacterium]|nr:hypothetical protein [Deltaproteobacteria bacterium]